MSYDSVRIDEQLRVLDRSIGDFITRYNFITLSAVLGLNHPRQTLFLFPGGIASQLSRATQAWNSVGPASQVFNYEVLWLGPNALLGGEARNLKMHTVAGEYRDEEDRIIIADDVASLFGVRPYVGFALWCSLKQLDWFIFPWDWRRSV